MQKYSRKLLDPLICLVSWSAPQQAVATFGAFLLAHQKHVSDDLRNVCNLFYHQCQQKFARGKIRYLAIPIIILRVKLQRWWCENDEGWFLQGGARCVHTWV
jgi:hypothetical protein